MEISTNFNTRPNFGTQIGPKLFHKLHTHPECISKENAKVIDEIIHNGSNDTVLEFHHAPAKLHELYNYNYQLILKGGVIDKKNTILKAQPDKNFNGEFPISFKDYGEHTMMYMMSLFNKRNNLNNKILEEVKNSEDFVAKNM